MQKTPEQARMEPHLEQQKNQKHCEHCSVVSYQWCAFRKTMALSCTHLLPPFPKPHKVRILVGEVAGGDGPSLASGEQGVREQGVALASL